MEQLKRLFFSKYSHTRTIPASLLSASLVALIMVSAATYYAVDQIRQLERSTLVLLTVGVPLKDSVHRLEKDLQKTEFLLHKALVLKDPSYFPAIEQKIADQKTVLANLKPLLLDATEARQAMELLSTGLQDYWRWIRDNQGRPGNAVPRLREGIIETQLADFHTSVDKLAVERAGFTMEAADHVTDVLLLLVIGTAIFGILISLLYVIVATRPMRDIRQALMRIGNGLFDQNLDLESFKELRELSHGINTMQAKLRELERAKTEFLSLISHELKTPLASFQSGIELLCSGGVGVLSGKQLKVVDIMHKQAIQLGTSIQELLDMQSIQTQRLIMDIGPHILSSIIKDAIERIQPLTTEKNQHIRWLVSSADFEVFADPERTRQILLNLLSNANKYSPHDTSIDLTIIRHDETAEIIVEDEGPGIPEQYLDSACNRFFQVPTEGAHLRGTGLGLAIVKEIAEAQQGSVELENRKPNGLRVRVRLPLCNQDHSKIFQV